MYKNIFKYDDWKRAEHMAVRTSVGWYLWTHQLLELTGPDAAAFLEHLYTGNIASLQVGRDRYTTMLNEQGEILDDVVILRLSEDTYWVSTLYATKCDDWWYFHQGDYDVEWSEVTADWQMLAVQGPKSREVLEQLCRDSVADQKFFEIRTNEIDGIPVKVNRGGYTGEKLGYEIYAAPDELERLETLVDAAVRKQGGRRVTEFQVMAWTLPTEAGLYYMRDLAHTNPLEVGLDRHICWDKDFIGRDALVKVRAAGPAREMVGFEVLADDFYIRSKQYGGPGEPVFLDPEQEEVGRVSKLVYSYVKEVSNGYILAKKGALKPGDRLKIHGADCVITGRSWLG